MFKRNIGNRAQILFQKWYRLRVHRYEYVPEDEERRGRLEQSLESNSVHLDSKVTLGILVYYVSTVQVNVASARGGLARI